MYTKVYVNNNWKNVYLERGKFSYIMLDMSIQPAEIIL